jgi:TPR repeat protein
MMSFAASMQATAASPRQGGRTASPPFKRVLQEAEKGDTSAIYILATLYYNGGRDVKQDHRQATKLFTIAAERGIAIAQYQLAEMYFYGTEIPQNDAQALRWYRAAAMQGMPEAQFGLGNIYSQGRGTAVDMAKAAYWYEQAAVQDYGPAQYELGKIYAAGTGVEKDLVTAYKWLSLASSRSVLEAVGDRDNLRSSMNEEQIAKAQREAALFVPRLHYNSGGLKQQKDKIAERAKAMRFTPQQ